MKNHGVRRRGKCLKKLIAKNKTNKKIRDENPVTATNIVKHLKKIATDMGK